MFDDLDIDREITPTLEFYDKIMNSTDLGQISKIISDMRNCILANIISGDMEIMMLGIAVQMKVNQFRIDETLALPPNQTIIITGGEDNYDPEEMQLEQFKESEFQDFVDGNVLPMKDFGKDDENI